MRWFIAQDMSTGDFWFLQTERNDLETGKSVPPELISPVDTTEFSVLTMLPENLNDFLNSMQALDGMAGEQNFTDALASIVQTAVVAALSGKWLVAEVGS